MARYRVDLGYPRKLASGREQKTDLVSAEDARVVDGILKLIDHTGAAVALYKPGYWTAVRKV